MRDSKGVWRHIQIRSVPGTRRWRTSRSEAILSFAARSPSLATSIHDPLLPTEIRVGFNPILSLHSMSLYHLIITRTAVLSLPGPVLGSRTPRLLRYQTNSKSKQLLRRAEVWCVVQLGFLLADEQRHKWLDEIVRSRSFEEVAIILQTVST